MEEREGRKGEEEREVGKGRDFCERVQSHPLTTFKKTELGLMTNLWHVRRALTTCAVWKGDWQDRERRWGEKEEGEGRKGSGGRRVGESKEGKGKGW